MALSICYWANYTQGKAKLARKSEDAINSDHVLHFLLDKESGIVKATVQASMRDTSYRIGIGLPNRMTELYQHSPQIII